MPLVCRQKPTDRTSGCGALAFPPVRLHIAPGRLEKPGRRWSGALQALVVDSKSVRRWSGASRLRELRLTGCGELPGAGRAPLGRVGRKTHDAFDIHRAHLGAGAGDRRDRTAPGRRYLSHHGGGVPAQLGAHLFLRRDDARPRPRHLNVHHLWVRDWRVFVTIFGWLLVIGGILRCWPCPVVQRAGESLIAHQRWPIAGAVVTLALGAFLTAWAIRTFGRRWAAAVPSLKRGKELGLGVPKRQAAEAQGERGSFRALIAP